MNNTKTIDISPMLNAYPDSVGSKLSDMTFFLKKDEFRSTFGSFYILPSIYNTDLDRGFSVIDYDLNRELASEKDLEDLKSLGISLKLDFILNHASVLSPQFKDLVKNGAASKYADFFINWNKFWEGCGEMTAEGYIKPDDEYIKDMFFRKPGLPLLMVRMPDGTDVPYWNTFYQEIHYPIPDISELTELADLQYLQAQRLLERIRIAISEGKPPKEIDFTGYEKYAEAVIAHLESRRQYLGQMDLNIGSDLVWEFYEDTLKKLKGYGATVVRLDAFAYAPKAPGRKNFLNEPETWDVLGRVDDLAKDLDLMLLPEIHAAYSEKIHEKVCAKGYMTYDFYLPGLLIHAIENHTPRLIAKWGNEILEKDMKVVNMLGCHDGIPLLDLKGLLSEEEILSLIDLIVSRGGFVKDLHGQKNMYYQVNATYYSALGEDDRKMLFARALQLFMPGKPQVWYLDLFAGKNDHEAVHRAGSGGHKEINRTNLSPNQVSEALKKDVVKEQLSLLRLRNTCPAFAPDSRIGISTNGSVITITWSKDPHTATLTADFESYEYSIDTSEAG